MDESNRVESRVSRLEGVVDSLADDVKGVTRAIDKLVDSQKTSWPTVFAGVGLIVTILFAFGSGYVRDITELKKEIKQLESTVIYLQITKGSY